MDDFGDILYKALIREISLSDFYSRAQDYLDNTALLKEYEDLPIFDSEKRLSVETLLIPNVLGPSEHASRRYVNLMFKYLGFIEESRCEEKFYLIEEIVPIIQRFRIDTGEYDNFVPALSHIFWLDYDDDVYDIGRKVLYVLLKIGTKNAFEVIKEIANSNRRGNYEANEILLKYRDRIKP